MTMRSEIIKPQAVIDTVQWPQVEKLDEELARLRRRLVFVLTDRVNREEVTEENEQALTTVMADLRGYFNPSQITAIRMYNRTRKCSEGGYTVNEISNNGSNPRREQDAVLQRLGDLTNRTIESIFDLCPASSHFTSDEPGELD